MEMEALEAALAAGAATELTEAARQLQRGSLEVYSS